MFKNYLTNINRLTAKIDETCVGCTLCLRFCPFDAIVGSNNCIHNVIQTICSGCEICYKICNFHKIYINNKHKKHVLKKNEYRKNHNNKYERLKTKNEKTLLIDE